MEESFIGVYVDITIILSDFIELLLVFHFYSLELEILHMTFEHESGCLNPVSIVDGLLGQQNCFRVLDQQVSDLFLSYFGILESFQSI